MTYRQQPHRRQFFHGHKWSGFWFHSHNIIFLTIFEPKIACFRFGHDDVAFQTRNRIRTDAHARRTYNCFPDGRVAEHVALKQKHWHCRRRRASTCESRAFTTSNGFPPPPINDHWWELQSAPNAIEPSSISIAGIGM